MKKFDEDKVVKKNEDDDDSVFLCDGESDNRVKVGESGNLGLSGVDKVVDYVTNDYIRSASSTTTNVRGTSASQKTMAKI